MKTLSITSVIFLFIFLPQVLYAGSGGHGSTQFVVHSANLAIIL